jgi:chorismate mutase
MKENSNLKINKECWLTKAKRPIIIAGPCSAETEEQVLQTAIRLEKTGKADIFRAGIWKPRTNPGCFEGVGTKGLPWLKRVKEITGMPVAVEVAKASHVELCLEFGIDIFWIGARTTVNPFAVQEIADSLNGVDVPVLVKNPINPDLALWNGSVERIRNAGVKEIGAIHRGFSNLGEQYYRNRPQWQIAIEFMRMNPDLPMICDPSHICGRRDILQDVGQKAMDLDYDGLMIETHIDPDNAWSDASQQITPETFGAMISNMKLRHDYQDNNRLQSKLEQMRETIDHIDEEIMNLISNRMKVARDIGKYKKDNDITIYQDKRWNEIIEKSKVQAGKSGISQEFILKYISAVHDESINQQVNIMKSDNNQTGYEL